MAKRHKEARPGDSLEGAEPSAPAPPPSSAIERTVVEAPNYARLYTNDTEVQITPWDFRFTFGVIEELPNPERRRIGIKSVGEVRMSPQHAKKLLAILTQQIEKYERVIGPIPLPPES